MANNWHFTLHRSLSSMWTFYRILIVLHGTLLQIKEKELRLALKWPTESRQCIDHYEEKYGIQITLSQQEKAQLRQGNPYVDLRVVKRQRNWEYILTLTHRLEVQDLVNKLSTHNPAITPFEFASSIANVYKILSDNIIHALNLMVQYELPPQGISNLSSIEKDCVEILKSV